MNSRPNIRKTIGTIVDVLSCIVLAALLVIAVAVLVKTYNQETSSVARIRLHEYLAAGFIAFFPLLLIPRLRDNFRWLMKFAHEFTHLAFAILFFRKIIRFKVDADDSYVSYSNSWFGYHAITLSPYCVPIFTLALIPWRFTTGTANWVFLAVIDALIGFTYAFHLCCWFKQIRLSQTDISGPGVVKSLLCIAAVQIFNLSLVLQLPSSGVQLAIQRVFWEFPSAFVKGLLAL